MRHNYNKFFLAINLILLLLCLAKSCPDDLIALDETFLGCCGGRPKYTSETCIDRLLENGTFSSVCLLNCMYKEFGIYDGGEIGLAAVKTFLDGQIGDEHYHEMYMNAFETCSKLDKKSIKERFSFIELKSNHNCDDYPQYFDTCIWYHTLANCPQKYATEDENCNTKREWVNQCLLKF